MVRTIYKPLVGRLQLNQGMATSLEGVNKLDQPLLKVQLIGLEGNFTFLPSSMDNWKFHFISTFSYFPNFMLEGRVVFPHGSI
jgi:hypothetical protein